MMPRGFSPVIPFSVTAPPLLPPAVQIRPPHIPEAAPIFRDELRGKSPRVTALQTVAAYADLVRYLSQCHAFFLRSVYP